jgi:secreted trypsin-like serine protease
LQYTENLIFLSLDQKFFTLAMNPARGLDGVCRGDSGGGRFVNNRENGIDNWVLVGLTSWGDINCVATDRVYRLDTASPLQFLEEVMANLNRDPAFYSCA